MAIAGKPKSFDYDSNDYKLWSQELQAKADTVVFVDASSDIRQIGVYIPAGTFPDGTSHDGAFSQVDMSNVVYSRLHINVLEMIANLYGLLLIIALYRHHGVPTCGVAFHIVTDNTTALAGFQKSQVNAIDAVSKGWYPFLFQVRAQLQEVALCTLFSSYIRSADNAVADHLSRDRAVSPAAETILSTCVQYFLPPWT